MPFPPKTDKLSDVEDDNTRDATVVEHKTSHQCPTNLWWRCICSNVPWVAEGVRSHQASLSFQFSARKSYLSWLFANLSAKQLLLSTQQSKTVDTNLEHQRRRRTIFRWTSLWVYGIANADNRELFQYTSNYFCAANSQEKKGLRKRNGSTMALSQKRVPASLLRLIADTSLVLGSTRIGLIGAKDEFINNSTQRITAQSNFQTNSNQENFNCIFRGRGAAWRQ